MKFLNQIVFLGCVGWIAMGCAPANEDVADLPSTLPEGCQPLYDGWDCFLPYPSNFFLTSNPATETGFEVKHEAEGKLLTAQEYSADVNDWKAPDGFSIHAPIIFSFEQRVDVSACATILGDKDASIAPAHCTLILDSSGNPVPHFVDVDGRAEEDGKQMIILRTLTALKPQTRYVVAVQNFNDLEGDRIEAPTGFQYLRDDISTQSQEIENERKRFQEDVFPVIQGFGVPRSDLQLAWDFTTGSVIWALSDMLQAKDLAIEWLAANTPEVSISSVVTEDSGSSAYTLYGEILGPLVMENQAPGSVLARDDSQQVRLNGEVPFPFTATIPRALVDNEQTGMALMYGHGFFGERVEVESGAPRDIGNKTNSVMFATDFLGMSLHDMGPVVANLGHETAYALQFTDRVAQGMVNQLVLARVIKNQFPLMEEFQKGDGAPYYDATSVNYMGISMGHILGGVLAALSTDISKYCLNVGGAVFTHMMSRAIPFDQFLLVLNVSIPDPFIQQKVIASLQPLFDRVDPAMWAPYVLNEPLPGETSIPERQVLMQIAIADTSVPNFSSYQHARLLGLDLLGPSSKTPWGFNEVVPADDFVIHSAMTVYDYGVDDSFYAISRAEEEGNVTHEAVRRSPEAIEQLRVFYESGDIINPCGGPCSLNLP